MLAMLKVSGGRAEEGTHSTHWSLLGKDTAEGYMFKEEIERIDISLGVLLLKLTSNQNLWCLCSRRCM